MFPQLAELKMFGTAIIPIEDTTVVEAKVEPGKPIFTNNIASDVAIITFYNETGEPIVGEVSFDFNIVEKNHEVTLADLQLIDQYYAALFNKLSDNVSASGTKTSYVYQLPD